MNHKTLFAFCTILQYPSKYIDTLFGQPAFDKDSTPSMQFFFIFEIKPSNQRKDTYAINKYIYIYINI